MSEKPPPPRGRRPAGGGLRRRREFRPVSPAVDRVLGHLQPPTPLAAVQSAWREVVGPFMADRARPVALHGTELKVACDWATVAQELELDGPRIAGELERVVGRRVVERVRCTATGST